MTSDSEPNALAQIPMTQFLTFRMARVHAKLNAQAARILKETSGLSLSQWRVIALIAVFGPERASVLSKKAEIDKGLFSRKLKTLVEDNIVLTSADPNDSRQQFLRLSPRGQTLYASTLPVMQRRQATLRGLLSEDELATFYSALEKIEDALERQEDALEV